MIGTVIIIGGGQAGAQAVETLRTEGFSGRLVLIGAEAQLPYQRPPLTKHFLSGEMTEDRLPFRHAAFYDEHRVERRLGDPVATIERRAGTVTLLSGEVIGYDRLLLCMGALSRTLACPGTELSGIHYIKDLADVPPVQATLTAGASVLVIGAGYIGLETAATAVGLGCKVTVLEMADRVMSRVASPTVSDFFSHQHRSRGVEVRTNTGVVRLEGKDRVNKVLCSDGTSYAPDIIIVGVGSQANVAIAEGAAIACGNGVLIDEYCCTEGPHIFAAGDCANQFNLRLQERVRLESVDNAFTQATTASHNLLGREVVHNRVPWFWSDQYHNKLLIAGLTKKADWTITRGDPALGSFSVSYIRSGEIVAIEAVNCPKDYMAARKLIEEHARPNVLKLSDVSVPLKQSAT